MKFEYLDHTADVKFRARGATIEEAFSNSAFALFNVMVDTEKVKPVKSYNVAVEGDDLKSLLFNFFDELIFLLDTENFFLSGVEEFKIAKNENYSLTAKVSGDVAANYETIGPEVKAATYNQMKIEEGKEVVIEAVLDI